MIVILSAREPTVSATRRASALLAARRSHALLGDDFPKRLVDTLDEIVSLLIQLVDAALRGRDLTVVARARFVFLVPQLDVGHRKPRYEISKCVLHGRQI